MLDCRRLWTGQRNFGIYGNFRPYCHIDSRDRECIGVTYIDVHLWWFSVGLSWKNKHWDDCNQTVGDRGVW